MRCQCLNNLLVLHIKFKIEISENTIYSIELAWNSLSLLQSNVRICTSNDKVITSSFTNLSWIQRWSLPNFCYRHTIYLIFHHRDARVVFKTSLLNVTRASLTRAGTINSNPIFTLSSRTWIITNTSEYYLGKIHQKNIPTTKTFQLW